MSAYKIVRQCLRAGVWRFMFWDCCKTNQSLITTRMVGHFSSPVHLFRFLVHIQHLNIAFRHNNKTVDVRPVADLTGGKVVRKLTTIFVIS